MLKLKSIFPKNFIICDDVRQETNMKHLLIGVYSGDIVIAEVGIYLTLCFYFELLVKNAGQYGIKLRISGPGDGAGELEVKFMTDRADMTVVLPSVRMDFLMDREGVFKIEFSEDGDEWHSVCEKKVLLTDTPIPSAIVSPKLIEQSPPETPES